MNFLLRNGPISFPDEDALMAACKAGSSKQAKLFLSENPVARIPFYNIENGKERCFELAYDHGHADFLRAIDLYGRYQDEWFLSQKMAKALRNNHIELVKYLFSLNSTPQKQKKFDFLVGSCLGDTDAMAGALESLSEIRPEDFDGLIQIPMGEDLQSFSSDPLECAIGRGHLNSIHYILNLGQSGVDWPVHEGHLAAAISAGNMEIVNLLLNSTSIDEEFYERGLLGHAAFSGNVEVVEWVLEELERRNITVDEGDISWAKDVAKSSQVLALLSDKFGDELSFIGFLTAAQKVNADVVNFYLNSAFIDTFDSSNLEQVIQSAIMNSRTENVDLIVKAQWDKLSQEQMDALFGHACQLGNLDIIQTLLESPRPPNLAASKCFQLAAQRGHVNVLKFLIGLNSTAIDPAAFDNKAVVRAALYEHLDALKFLVSLHPQYPKIDPAARNNTAFRTAITSENLKMARYLVSLKDKFPAISASDKNNEAMKVSVKYRRQGMVDFLLSLPEEMGIDRSIADMDPTDVVLDNEEDGDESD